MSERAIPTVIDRDREVRCELDEQTAAWSRGFTRRRFIQGMGMVGAAAIGSQLVTAKAAYAAPGTSNGNTLITVFLRGGADHLRTLIPASNALGLGDMVQLRPDLVPGDADRLALPGGSGWALNKGLAPLLPLWGSGELAFVPAVSDPAIPRSHFEAASFLERGGTAAASTGWLDRTVSSLGPGTTFRAMSVGSALTPASMAGSGSELSVANLASLALPTFAGYEAKTADAVANLYRGFDGYGSTQVTEMLAAVAQANALQSPVASAPQNGARYSNGGFAQALSNVATVLRAELGLQVCTIDVGGWDNHSAMAGDIDRNLADVASSLATFMQDLGPDRRKRVSVMVLTEFGRRVAQNGNLGADHGHGGVVWLLGGGVQGGKILGKWNGLAPAALDQGDVPGLNSPFDIMADLVRNRLGVGSVSKIFPGRTIGKLSVSRKT